MRMPYGSVRVASVQTLLRLNEPNGAFEEDSDDESVMLPPPAVLRLAICRVYTSQPQQCELWVARKH